MEKSKKEVAEQEALAKQQDPLTVIQQKEMALKEAEFAHKKEMDLAKLQVTAKAKEKDQEIEVAKVAVKAVQDKEKSTIEERKQGLQEGIDLAREFLDE